MSAAAPGPQHVPVPPGVVRDVEGDAPLATVIRLDRDLARLMAEIASLYERLHDVAEHAVERLASRH